MKKGVETSHLGWWNSGTEQKGGPGGGWERKRGVRICLGGSETVRDALGGGGKTGLEKMVGVKDGPSSGGGIVRGGSRSRLRSSQGQNKEPRSLCERGGGWAPGREKKKKNLC